MLQVRYWLCSPVQLPAVLAATDAHRSVWPSLELPAVSCATHAQFYTRLQTVSNTRGIPNNYDFRPRGLLRPLSDLRDALDHQEPQTRSSRGHRHHAAAITAELHPLQGIHCKTAVWPIQGSLKAAGVGLRRSNPLHAIDPLVLFLQAFYLHRLDVRLSPDSGAATICWRRTRWAPHNTLTWVSWPRIRTSAGSCPPMAL